MSILSISEEELIVILDYTPVSIHLEVSSSLIRDFNEWRQVLSCS